MYLPWMLKSSSSSFLDIFTTVTMNPMPPKSRFSRESKAELSALIISSCEPVCATAGSIAEQLNLLAWRLQTSLRNCQATMWTVPGKSFLWSSGESQRLLEQDVFLLKYYCFTAKPHLLKLSQRKRYAFFCLLVMTFGCFLSHSLHFSNSLKRILKPPP